MDEERLLTYHSFTREHGVNRPLYLLARLILIPFFLVYFRLSRDRPRARQGQGAADRRRQPPQLPRPVRDRRLAAVAAAPPLRRQGRALREALAGLDPQPARRLSRAPRPVRRADPDHLARGARARRRRLHLPGGNPAPDGLARSPEARLRAPRARDRAPPSCRSPSMAPSRSGAAGRSARRRSRSASGARSPSRAPRTPRRRSPTRSAPAIWPVIELQWEWLGGLPPLRKAAVIGAGSWGTAVAVLLARGGLEVQLGTRTPERAEEMNETRTNEEYLPGVQLPDSLTVKRAADIELAGIDLVCLAVPSAALPQAVGAIGDRVGQRASVLLLSKGMVAPMAALPSEYVSERIRARAIASLGGPAHAKEAVSGHGGAGARQPRRRPARPARQRLRRGRPGLRALRGHDRRRGRRRGQERRRPRRRGGPGPGHERGGDRHRAGLAGVRRLRTRPRAPSTRPSPASPGSAT